jgi:hypothetical protein
MPSDSSKMSIMTLIKVIESNISNFHKQSTDDDKYKSLSLIYTHVLELYEFLYLFKEKLIVIEPRVLKALYNKIKPIHKMCKSKLRMTIINCKKQLSGENCQRRGLKIFYNTIMATFDVIVKDLHKFSKSSETYVSETELYNSLNDIPSDVIEREVVPEIKKRMRTRKKKRRATRGMFSAVEAENTARREEKEAMRAKYSAVEDLNTARREEREAIRAKYSAVEAENTARREEKEAIRAKYKPIENENTARRKPTRSSSRNSSTVRRITSKSSPRRRTSASSPRRTTSASSPRRRTSASSPRRTASVPSPRRRTSASSPRRTASVPSPRRRTSASTN